MASYLKLGECLKLLLSAAGISINRLSKAINVDSSLVNRWVNDKRIPPYNTNYIDNISEYLSKNIKNSYQIQHLNELYEAVCQDSDLNMNIKDKIMKILFEAQGYSIECRKSEMQEAKAQKAKKKELLKFSNNRHTGCNYGNIAKQLSLEEYISSSGHISFSTEDKIVSGSKNVSSAVLSLFKAASGKNPGINNTICISFINDYDLISHTTESLVYCRNALLEAVNRGWKVLCILRLNSNKGRTMRFINFALPLMKTGRFGLYSFTRQDSLSSGREFIIIPETGAIIGLQTKVNSRINNGLFLKSNAAIEIFLSYFNMLAAPFSEPAIKYYTEENIHEFDCVLAENEEKIGNRLIYRHSLCSSILPEKLYRKLLKRKGLSYDEILRASEDYYRKINAFNDNILSYEYKDMYSMDSIIDLVEYGRFNFCCNAEIESMYLSTQDVIELLHHIICLLEAYDNYHIAFIPQKLDKYMEYADFSCIIKERQSFTLEAYLPSGNMPDVRLAIDEPLLVKAFDEYFCELWNHLSPESKNKSNLIKWLQYQIDFLKDSKNQEAREASAKYASRAKIKKQKRCKKTEYNVLDLHHIKS